MVGRGERMMAKGKRWVEDTVGKYWRSAINARIPWSVWSVCVCVYTCVCVCLCVLQARSHKQSRKIWGGQSYWGCNLRALYWKKACVCLCMWASFFFFRVCGCFTKTTHHLLAPRSLDNITIMHCDSSAPGPRALSRESARGGYLGRLEASTPPPPRFACLSSSPPLSAKTAHNYCLSILHV